MNRLIHESSPYLLQHAANPVDWYPYGYEALKDARESNRPLLISIGYSACHWCHVMEHESFSNPAIAEIMNRNFICIKVDREERPDLDHLYMGAVQLLHNSGGWPLNCFALPDGRPFWGGTYFRPGQWESLLAQISELFKNSLAELEDQAERLMKGVYHMGLITPPEGPPDISFKFMDETYERLSWSFDSEWGGLQGAPKFPMPAVWQFVMDYHKKTGKAEALSQLKTTLLRMVCGGMYDRLGGGFARYSTDAGWKVPHFEKMLYDNAQLGGLYSNMFRLTGDRFYLEVAEQTFGFLLQRLRSSDGLFYSAFDADSEGEEGAYYLWTREQVKEILPEYGDLLSDYWGIGDTGLWENGKSILMRPVDEAHFASRQHLSELEMKQLLMMAGKVLLAERDKREPPLLDDKIVLSWNSMNIKSLCEAYKASGNRLWLDAALKAATIVLERTGHGNGPFRRIITGTGDGIPAMLDDLAFLADAWIALYQVTFDEAWLWRAETLVNHVFDHFSDDQGPLFWYSQSTFANESSAPPAARVLGSTDGAEPSGNAIMAENLLNLGLYLENRRYTDHASEMVNFMQQRISSYPAAHAVWARIALKMAGGTATLVITGPDAFRNATMLNRKFLPGIIIAAACDDSDLPIFKNRFESGKNLIFHCSGNSCAAPVSNVVDLII